MHSVLLVDDEPLFLRHLGNMIDWKRLGCEICGEAIDGIEALDRMKQCHPDIIVLDIGIPYVDGLSICELVQTWSPRPRIILSTAHDTFDFARRAIKLGVTDYLLKPFESSDLIRAIERCIQQLRQETRNLTPTAREASDARAHQLRRLLDTGVPEDGLDPGILSSPGLSVCMLACGTQQTARELEDRLPETLSPLYGQRILTAGSIGGALALVLQWSADDTQRIWSERFDAFLANASNANLSIAFGPRVDSPFDLRTSLQIALRCLENRSILGKRVLLPDDLGTLIDSAPAFGPEDIPVLIRCFEANDNEQADAVIDRVFGIRDGHALSFQYVSALCYSLTGMVCAHYRRDRGTLASCQLENEQLLRDLNTCQTQEEVQSVLRNYVYELFSSMLDISRTSRSESLVSRIRNLLGQLYGNPDLSVTDVSNALFFENSYLRRIYKTHTGKTIIQELEDIRIKAAMQLLKEGLLRHGDIARRVGYANPLYFSRRFKLATGLTPTEYQERHIP
mgnify:CR=1 FL=1